MRPGEMIGKQSIDIDGAIPMRFRQAPRIMDRFPVVQLSKQINPKSNYYAMLGWTAAGYAIIRRVYLSRTGGFYGIRQTLTIHHVLPDCLIPAIP